MRNYETSRAQKILPKSSKHTYRIMEYLNRLSCSVVRANEGFLGEEAQFLPLEEHIIFSHEEKLYRMKQREISFERIANFVQFFPRSRYLIPASQTKAQ